ncbi:hypothetical protein GCM10023215_44340 [Pseudonocardia yuanmonensis]|uniref:DUF3040 domain-containing protein n=1 Tax=Pseudonocardia yuanmonensis TaxID=1095914 RepID=A0ABP8X6S1_9PSEU
MVDDDDWRVLRDVERELAQDAKLARAFEQHERAQRTQPYRRGARIALLSALSVGLLLVALGTPIGAVAAMATSGLIWLAWRYPDSTSWDQR